VVEKHTSRNLTLIARLDSKDKSDFRFPDVSDGEVVLLQFRGFAVLLLLLFKFFQIRSLQKHSFFFSHTNPYDDSKVSQHCQRGCL